MTRAAPVALTVTAAASWAAAAILTKVALRELTPLDVLGIELFAPALVMVLLVAARRGPVLSANWRTFAALGALEPGLSFGLIDYGFSRPLFSTLDPSANHALGGAGRVSSLKPAYLFRCQPAFAPICISSQVTDSCSMGDDALIEVAADTRRANLEALMAAGILSQEEVEAESVLIDCVRAGASDGTCPSGNLHRPGRALFLVPQLRRVWRH